MKPMPKFAAEVEAAVKEIDSYIGHLILPDVPCEITEEKRGMIFDGHTPAGVAETVALTKELLIKMEVFNPKNAKVVQPLIPYTEENIPTIQFLKDVASARVDGADSVILSGNLCMRILKTFGNNFTFQDMVESLNELGIENVFCGETYYVNNEDDLVQIWSPDYIAVFKSGLGHTKGWISADKMKEGMAVKFNFFPKIEKPESLALIETHYK